MAEYKIVEDGHRVGLYIKRENLEAVIGVNSWHSVDGTREERLTVTDMRYARFSEGESTGEAEIKVEENKIRVLHGVTIDIPEDVMDEFVKEIKSRPELEDNY